MAKHDAECAGVSSGGMANVSDGAAILEDSISSIGATPDKKTRSFNSSVFNASSSSAYGYVDAGW